jgi:hypothetical protein
MGTNAVSVPSSPRNFGQKFPDFVVATYKFLLDGGHTTFDRKIKIETLDAVLGHLKPTDPEFKIVKCLKSFPSKFQIDELSESVYAFPRDDVLLSPETPSPVRSLTPIQILNYFSAEYRSSPFPDDSVITITKI